MWPSRIQAATYKRSAASPAGRLSHPAGRLAYSGYQLITTTTSGYFDVNTVANGQNVTGKNFGDTQKVLITGTLWKDANGNGLKDTGDSGLSGWRVFIDTNKNGVFDAGESSVLTDALQATTRSKPWRPARIACAKSRAHPAGVKRTTPTSGLLRSNGRLWVQPHSGKNFGNTQEHPHHRLGLQ